MLVKHQLKNKNITNATPLPYLFSCLPLRDNCCCAFCILQYKMYNENITVIRSFVFDVINLLNVVRYLFHKHMFPHRNLGLFYILSK